jgi:hypothetical protein
VETLTAELRGARIRVLQYVHGRGSIIVTSEFCLKKLPDVLVIDLSQALMRAAHGVDGTGNSSTP